MAFCNCRHDLLFALVLRQSLLDLQQRGFCPLQIRFIHHHDVGYIEHHNFLQLQSGSVIGIHHQDGLIDQLVAKWQCFLASTNGFDNHIIEPGTREQGEATFRRRRKSPGVV